MLLELVVLLTGEPHETRANTAMESAAAAKQKNLCFFTIGLLEFQLFSPWFWFFVIGEFT